LVYAGHQEDGQGLSVLRIFAGYDEREAIGFHAFAQSLIETSSNYSLTPMTGAQGDGTNNFNLCRFRVPMACGYAGWALWVDGADMLCRSDISELMSLRNSRKALMVVKHDYKTKHARKYVGTEMEADNRDYPRKNQSSVILWNCGHPALRYSQEILEGDDGVALHRMAFVDDDQIGTLPAEWNHLVGEFEPNPRAKLAHFTLGIPGFDAYVDCEFAEEWRDAASRVNRGMQYDFKRHSER
jgi:hypothetical protein